MPVVPSPMTRLGADVPVVPSSVTDAVKEQGGFAAATTGANRPAWPLSINFIRLLALYKQAAPALVLLLMCAAGLSMDPRAHPDPHAGTAIRADLTLVRGKHPYHLCRLNTGNTGNREGQDSRTSYGPGHCRLYAQPQVQFFAAHRGARTENGWCPQVGMTLYIEKKKLRVFNMMSWFLQCFAILNKLGICVSYSTVIRRQEEYSRVNLKPLLEHLLKTKRFFTVLADNVNVLIVSHTHYLSLG